MMTESTPPAPESAPPDVAALLAEVEAAVAARRNGLYRPAEVRRVEDESVRLQPVLDDEGRRSRRGLRRARRVVGRQEVRHQHPPPWPCRPAAGRGQAARAPGDPAYVNIVLARQTAFNAELVELLNALIAARRPAAAPEKAERRIEELEDAAGRFGASAGAAHSAPAASAPGDGA
jgi:hypothetical protein